MVFSYMQERLQLLREMERLKEEEVVAAYEKKQRAAALMQEVAQANAAQISRKQEQRCLEQEEEMRIAQYIRHKDAREQVWLKMVVTCIEQGQGLPAWLQRYLCEERIINRFVFVAAKRADTD
jgi:predicted ATPase with chaperone activity